MTSPLEVFDGLIRRRVQWFGLIQKKKLAFWHMRSVICNCFPDINPFTKPDNGPLNPFCRLFIILAVWCSGLSSYIAMSTDCSREARFMFINLLSMSKLPLKRCICLLWLLLGEFEAELYVRSFWTVMLLSVASWFAKVLRVLSPTMEELQHIIPRATARNRKPLLYLFLVDGLVNSMSTSSLQLSTVMVSVSSSMLMMLPLLSLYLL